MAWRGMTYGEIAARAGALWLFFFVLYVLFAGNVSGAELAAGAVVAVLVGIFEIGVRGNSERRLHVGPMALRPLAAACGRVPVDTARLLAAFAAVWRPLPTGEFVEAPWPDPAAEANTERRAVAIAAESLAPNAYVILRTAGPGPLLMHRLLPESAEGSP